MTPKSLSDSWNKWINSDILTDDIACAVNQPVGYCKAKCDVNDSCTAYSEITEKNTRPDWVNKSGCCYKAGTLTAPQPPASSDGINIWMKPSERLAGSWSYICKGGASGKLYLSSIKNPSGQLINYLYDVYEKGVLAFSSITLKTGILYTVPSGTGAGTSFLLSKGVRPDGLTVPMITLNKGTQTCVWYKDNNYVEFSKGCYDIKTFAEQLGDANLDDCVALAKLKGAKVGDKIGYQNVNKNTSIGKCLKMSSTPDLMDMNGEEGSCTRLFNGDLAGGELSNAVYTIIS